MSSFDFGPIPRPKLSIDRRGERRTWIPQEASLTLAGSNRACKVRNMSRNGAMLSVDDATSLPAVFGLQLVGDSLNRTARTRWRVATVVGVELIDKSAGESCSPGEVMPLVRSRRNMRRGQHGGTRNILMLLASAVREFIAPRYRPELHYMRGPGPACARFASMEGPLG